MVPATYEPVRRTLFTGDDSPAQGIMCIPSHDNGRCAIRSRALWVWGQGTSTGQNGIPEFCLRP